MAAWNFSTISFVLVMAAMLLGYSILTAIHRLLFSPISKFPGPKLAALTFWWALCIHVHSVCFEKGASLVNLSVMTEEALFLTTPHVTVNALPLYIADSAP